MIKGTQTVEEAAKSVVKCGTLDNDGPTRKFFKEKEIPW